MVGAWTGAWMAHGLAHEVAHELAHELAHGEGQLPSTQNYPGGPGTVFTTFSHDNDSNIANELHTQKNDSNLAWTQQAI